MELINYPRFLHAIDEAIQGLELEARCYGYLEDSEHSELIRMLKEYQAKIEEKKNQEHDSWKAQMQKE